MKKRSVFKIIKNGLIVSCQASGDEPLNKPEILALFAKSAILGGAVGIRTEGFEKTKIIVQSVDVPVIGLIKSKFQDKSVRITGTFKDVEKLIKTKCSIIAIDGTFRKRENFTGPEFINKCKKEFPEIIIMADIAELEEGIACQKAGADCISTTLSGYTPNTYHYPKNKPDLKLLTNLVKCLKIPIVAEGKYNTPLTASKAIKSGAWSVVVGTAITRPITITKWFTQEILKNLK